MALPSRAGNADSAGWWGAHGGIVQVSSLWWDSGEIKTEKGEGREGWQVGHLGLGKDGVVH